MPSVTGRFVVLVLQGSDLEKNGSVLRLPTLDEEPNDSYIFANFKKTASAKVGLDSQDIIFRDANGKALHSMEAIFEATESNNALFVEPTEAVNTVIPGPKPRPIVGNLYDILPDSLNQWRKVHAAHGPLVKVQILGMERVTTNDPVYAELFAKESEFFTKKVVAPLAEFKPVGGQGLFTTDSDDPDWKLAHKLLMPAFSPKAIKQYTTEMGIIAHKTADIFSHFANTGEDVPIDFWTTCLTFETIGKIGFGFDFHLCDSPDVVVHPFISAMAFCLNEGIARAARFQVWKKLPSSSNYRYEQELRLMQSTVEEVLAARKSSPDAQDMAKDLLGFMLNAVDEGTGSPMTDKLIRDQVLTFLIAGHETTSNTLAWTLFELYRNPHVLHNCLQEIVNVGIVDGENPTQAQVAELKYIERVLKETLRYYSPVRALVKQCIKDVVLPGNYLIRAGTNVSINVDSLHHNPKVYPNPEVYDPDRWIPENESQRSTYSWLPFSIGPRGCIGRQFSMQEAKIVLAVWLRKFEFTPVTPDEVTYDPRAATTRPMSMNMKITFRQDLPERTTNPVIAIPAQPMPDDGVLSPITRVTVGKFPLPPLTVLYGSNTGTAQDFATIVSKSARQMGFESVNLCTLNDWELVKNGANKPRVLSAAETLQGTPMDSLVIVITSTYNGQPPENATSFASWLVDPEVAKAKPLEHSSFVVFGCGNSQWSRTYQAFPALIDDQFEALGGSRAVSAGVGDANKDIDNDFTQFFAGFWTHIAQMYGQENSGLSKAIQSGPSDDAIHINYINPEDVERWEAAKNNSNGTFTSTVVVNRELSSDPERRIRHIEVELDPEHSAYLPGDHLEVTPQNDPQIVEAVAKGFGLILDATFEIEITEDIGSARTLAAVIKGPCTVRNALTYYADLTSPPSRNLLNTCAERVAKKNENLSPLFRKLTQPAFKDDYEKFVSDHRTLLDFLTAFPIGQDLSLKDVLCALQAMTPRRYSIASAAAPGKHIAALTVGVVRDVVTTSSGKKIVYPGQASGFLARCDRTPVKINARVLSSRDSFRPPKDPNTPIIMISAGTGVAPFLGFLQHRAAVDATGTALMYFGCRTDADFIYREELNEYVQKKNLTELHVAFSRKDAQKKYVQHLLLEQGVRIWNLLSKHNAVIYVCGSASGMAKDVHSSIHRIAVQIGGLSDEKAEEFLDGLQTSSRYNEDVWG